MGGEDRRRHRSHVAHRRLPPLRPAADVQRPHLVPRRPGHVHTHLRGRNSGRDGANGDRAPAGGGLPDARRRPSRNRDRRRETKREPTPSQTAQGISPRARRQAALLREARRPPASSAEDAVRDPPLQSRIVLDGLRATVVSAPCALLSGIECVAEPFADPLSSLRRGGKHEDASTAVVRYNRSLAAGEFRHIKQHSIVGALRLSPT